MGLRIESYAFLNETPEDYIQLIYGYEHIKYFQQANVGVGLMIVLNNLVYGKKKLYTQSVYK